MVAPLENDGIVPPLEVKGGPDALRPYFGKWVALDAAGEIRASGATFEEAAKAAERSKVQDPEFFLVPAGLFVG
jgi:hypothetical protein